MPIKPCPTHHLKSIHEPYNHISSHITTPDILFIFFCCHLPSSIVGSGLRRAFISFVLSSILRMSRLTIASCLISRAPSGCIFGVAYHLGFRSYLSTFSIPAYPMTFWKNCPPSGPSLPMAFLRSFVLNLESCPGGMQLLILDLHHPALR